MFIKWRERIVTMLEDDPGGRKARFLRPLLEQGDRQGWDWLPTSTQKRVLRIMWKGFQRRRALDIVGEAVEI